MNVRPAKRRFGKDQKHYDSLAKVQSKRRKTERYSSPNPGGLAYQPDDGEGDMCVHVHEAISRDTFGLCQSGLRSL